jgi:hypothetical protein
LLLVVLLLLLLRFGNILHYKISVGTIKPNAVGKLNSSILHALKDLSKLLQQLVGQEVQRRRLFEDLLLTQIQFLLELRHVFQFADIRLESLQLGPT